MNLAKKPPVALGIVGVFVLISIAHTARGVVSAQTRKRVFVTRLYTGPDNQTHAEEVEATFSTAGGIGVDVAQLLKNAGAELHRIPAGTVQDWHTAPRRQYVITLSGHSEIEVAGGKKISTGPGHINLVEDTTGKGHITTNIGSENHVVVTIVLADQTPSK